MQGTSLPVHCLTVYYKHTNMHNGGRQTDTYLQHTWVFVVNFWLWWNIFSLPIITTIHCVLLFYLLSQEYVPQNINSKKIQTNKNALGVGFLVRGKPARKSIFLYFSLIRSLLSSKKYGAWNKLYHPAFFFIQILARARQYANENRLINDSLIFSRHFSLRSALNWCSSKRIRRIKSLYQFLLPRYFSPS